MTIAPVIELNIVFEVCNCSLHNFETHRSSIRQLGGVARLFGSG